MAANSTPRGGDYEDPEAERIAALFHRHYELQASAFGYETRPESAVPWSQVPATNRALMVSVVRTLLDLGVIRPGDSDSSKDAS